MDLRRKRLRKKSLPFIVPKILSRDQPDQKPSKGGQQLPAKLRALPGLWLPAAPGLPGHRGLRVRERQGLRRPKAKQDQPEPRLPRAEGWHPAW